MLFVMKAQHLQNASSAIELNDQILFQGKIFMVQMLIMKSLQLLEKKIIGRLQQTQKLNWYS